MSELSCLKSYSPILEAGLFGFLLSHISIRPSWGREDNNRLSLSEDECSQFCLRSVTSLSLCGLPNVTFLCLNRKIKSVFQLLVRCTSMQQGVLSVNVCYVLSLADQYLTWPQEMKTDSSVGLQATQLTGCVCTEGRKLWFWQFF